MSKKVYRKVNREPSHAGRILKTGFLDVHGLQIETVAELLGISRVHLSRIINGHSPVTPDLAIRLGILTQTSAGQWLTIQAKYDTYRLQQQRNFCEYQEALNRWAACTLTMSSENRQLNQSMCESAREEVAELAKQFGKRKRVSSKVS